MKRVLAAISVALLAGAVPLIGPTGTALAAPTGTIYNSIPSPLPGNLPSVGEEAYAFNEFGNQIKFGGTARTLDSVTLTLSSWACTSGHWYNDTCSTTPGATYPMPMTLNIYQVGTGPAAGNLIATGSQTFNVPYRPSDDNTLCPPAATTDNSGRWYSTADHTCYHGLATNVTFDFSSQNVMLPDSVVFGVVYNTTTYGPHPIGQSAPCFTSSGGCFYDSLNIALANEATDVTVGSDPNPGTIYQNSPYRSQYCDNGLAGTSIFRLDSPTSACWVPYTPAVQFVAKVAPPTSKDQCKDGGWQQFNNPSFKNQGECVSYVNHQGKHGGNG
jgi:hypothetical protein